MAKTTKRSDSHELPTYLATITANHCAREAAGRTPGVTQRTLERWHSIGWEPLFLKMSGRMVYREKGVIDLRTTTSGGVYPIAGLQQTDLNPKGLLQNICSMCFGNAVRDFWRHT